MIDYKVIIKELADIVIVSAGGHPKGISHYQAKRALENAKHAIKNGGTIILVAGYEEKYAEEIFNSRINKFDIPYYQVEENRSNFEIIEHKSVVTDTELEESGMYIVLNIEGHTDEKASVKLYSDLQIAYNDAIKKRGESSRVIVMPYGCSTLPVLKNDVG